MPKSQLTIRIDDKLLEKLKIISELEMRSLNNQLEYFLAKAISEYERQNELIQIPEETK